MFSHALAAEGLPDTPMVAMLPDGVAPKMRGRWRPIRGEPRRATSRLDAAPAPADKVGRNDPCPCGSGKKYKRCCEAKDREREASPYAGMTMEEALKEPGRHGDPRIIEKIPEEQLAGLDLAGLARRSSSR